MWPGLNMLHTLAALYSTRGLVLIVMIIMVTFFAFFFLVNELKYIVYLFKNIILKILVFIIDWLQFVNTAEETKIYSKICDFIKCRRNNRCSTEHIYCIYVHKECENLFVLCKKLF